LLELIKRKISMNGIDTIKILGSLLGNGGLSKSSGGNVLGNILGNVLGGGQNQQTQGGGMLGDILGNLIGSNQKSTSGGSMADMLGGLLGGGQRQQPSNGGLGDLIGSLLGGGQASSNSNSGGMGDLLGNLLGGGKQNSDGLGGSGGLGGLLGGALTKYAQMQNSEASNPSHDNCDHLPMGTNQAQAVDHATLIIRAMINAAKSDGNIDKAEQEKVIKKLGDITREEADFVRAEFNAPLDANAFINSIPRGMEKQIYAVSLMAIDLDNNKEAHYLAQLAKGFRINSELANNIHSQLGAPKIFS
jgi:uncharacterized membrane protein YebE (DUF533 family)